MDTRTRMRVRGRLAGERQMLQALIDGARDCAVFTLDAHGRVADWNSGAERITGHAAADIVGQPWRCLHLPDAVTRGLPEQLLQQAAADGRVEIDLWHLRRDGLRFNATDVITALRDARGRLRGYTVVTHDQTLRGRSYEGFRWLMDVTSIGIVIANERGDIVLLNKEAGRLFGYVPQELIGKSVETLIPQRFRDAHVGHRIHYRDAPRARVMGAGLQLFGVRSDGSEFPVEIGLTPLQTEQGFLVATTIIDISARNRAEAALVQAQKMEAVGQLTGGVAHDFNNLLTIISGNLQLLAERVAHDVLNTKLVGAASGAAMRGAELVRGLLAFSRKQVLQPQAVSLNHVAAQMLGLLQRTLGENIEVALVKGPHLWDAMADPAHIESALLNLAVNARDAMPRGGKLTIETANVHLDEAYAAAAGEVRAGDYVMLAVSDTGSGMSPETLEHALEPFFTTKPPGKGSGLGLSMVFGFAKQSGGHLKIYSELGLGTTIKLYLPRTGPGARRSARPTAALARYRGGETVLVLEDDRGVAELAVTFLTALGYRVLQAADGPAALAVVDSGETIDLLFADLVLAGAMSGADVADEVRRRHPGVKVLYTSGYPRETIVHNGRLDEGAHLLPKPYSRERLAHAVRHVLDEVA
ncbi:MAG TPA: PAS domain S-box protein [Rhodocyclaceae bacterium]|nr:PAS domain S-box protein [Rhodocyclaceae bacterium]